jgi:hypothetical protein
MDGTDESATSTTDHAITNFSAHKFRIGCVGVVWVWGKRAASLAQDIPVGQARGLTKNEPSLTLV